MPAPRVFLFLSCETQTRHHGNVEDTQSFQNRKARGYFSGWWFFPENNGLGGGRGQKRSQGQELDRAYRYSLPSAVIKSFADKRTAAIFIGRAIRDLPMKVQRHARAKLLIIEAADRLDDLRIPPGNQLEALRGDRQGQYSIRINKQWRICFIWRNGEAWQVEIVDYH